MCFDDGTPDGSPSDQAQAQASALNLVAQFQQGNQELNDFAAQVQQINQLNIFNVQNGAPPDPEVATLGQELLKRRQEYEALLAKFQYIYRAAFGQTVPGLSGMSRRLGFLGADPITWVIVIGILAGIIYAMTNWFLSIQVNRQQATNTQQRQQDQADAFKQTMQAVHDGRMTPEQANKFYNDYANSQQDASKESAVNKIPWKTLMFGGVVIVGIKALLG